VSVPETNAIFRLRHGDARLVEGLLDLTYRLASHLQQITATLIYPGPDGQRNSRLSEFGYQHRGRQIGEDTRYPTDCRDGGPLCSVEIEIGIDPDVEFELAFRLTCVIDDDSLVDLRVRHACSS